MRWRQRSERPGLEARADDGARDFWTPATAAALVAYLLAVLTWFQPEVTNDGRSYLDFVRRLLGEQAQGYAYQFGAALWDLPFYAVGTGIAAVGPDELSGVRFDELGFTLGSVVAVGLLFPVGHLLLRDSGLDHAAIAVLLVVAGSPLVYSVLFSPYDAHSADALFATLLALLLVRSALGERTSVELALAIGATLGLLVVIRYANAVLAVGVAIVLAGRRQPTRVVLAAAAAALAVLGVLLALPLLRGIPFGSSATPELDAAASLREEIEVDPLAPLKMLVTMQRGLFVWTPLTLFAVVGVVLLWRRQPHLRLVLAALGANAAALLAFHVVWGKYWTGGFGFSQRYLIGLTPVFVLGTAELLHRVRWRALVVLLPCVAWTGFLALNHYYGYEGISAEDGVDDVVVLYTSGEDTPEDFLRTKLGDPAVERWRAYVSTLRGGS